MSGEEHTASSLSDRLDIKGPTLSHYLGMLVEAGIVEVRPCLEDLRVKRLSLSGMGRALLFKYENEMLFHSMGVDE